MAQAWTTGRGKLGPIAPLLGAWLAEAESPMGPIRCTRVFERFGDGHVRLEAEWRYGKGDRPPYRELAMITPDAEGGLAIRSFTNDGKLSQGRLVAALDQPAGAIAFQSEMPAGLARQVYWPDAETGFRWAVEAKTRTGWSRFTEHHYRAQT